MDHVALKQLRAEKIAEARGILDSADAETRDLTTEENDSYESLVAESEKIVGQIAREERQLALEVDLTPVAAVAPIVPAQESTALGLTQSETRAYSLFRAIEAQASSNWQGAGFELEVSNAIAKRSGRDARGFYVPVEAFRSTMVEQRVQMDVADDTTALVQTLTDSTSFVDMLRDRIVAVEAGATVITGLVGNLNIPRQTISAGATWMADETSTVVPVDSKYDSISLVPKTVGAASDISRLSVVQSNPSVEGLVRMDLGKAIANAIDAAVFHGSGSSGEPTGIENATGVSNADTGTNSAAITRNHMVALETAVTQSNGTSGRLCYVTNAKVLGALKKLELGSSSRFVGDDNTVNGYPVFVSNAIKSNFTKGSHSAADLSAIIFGDMSEVVIGEFGTGGVDILVDPYGGAAGGRIKIWAFHTLDIGIRHGASFALCDDADTA